MLLTIPPHEAAGVVHGPTATDLQLCNCLLDCCLCHALQIGSSCCLPTRQPSRYVTAGSLCAEKCRLGELASHKGSVDGRGAAAGIYERAQPHAPFAHIMSFSMPPRTKGLFERKFRLASVLAGLLQAHSPGWLTHPLASYWLPLGCQWAG